MVSRSEVPEDRLEDELRSFARDLEVLAKGAEADSASLGRNDFDDGRAAGLVEAIKLLKERFPIGGY